MPCILASLRKFLELEHGTYEGKLRLPHKHYPRLVLICVLSSIARPRKVIQYPYGFGCGKGEIGIAMTADNKSGRALCQCNVLQWKDEIRSR